MAVNLEQAQSNPQVTILSIAGDLDASTYRQVIDKASEARDGGAKYLLIDMSEMDYMSSSGLVALHSIALLMRGEAMPDLEHGWGAFRSLDRDRESGTQTNVKLLKPNEKVERALETTGMKAYFEIFAEFEPAINSFG